MRARQLRCYEGRQKGSSSFTARGAGRRRGDGRLSRWDWAVKIEGQNLLAGGAAPPNRQRLRGRFCTCGNGNAVWAARAIGFSRSNRKCPHASAHQSMTWQQCGRTHSVPSTHASPPFLSARYYVSPGAPQRQHRRRLS